MSNNLDSLFNGSENLCGNISKDILSESIINILNESNVTIRACLKYKELPHTYVLVSSLYFKVISFYKYII